MQGLHRPSPSNRPWRHYRPTLANTGSGGTRSLLLGHYRLPVPPGGGSPQPAASSCLPTATTTASPPTHRPPTQPSPPPQSPDPNWSRRAALLSLPFCAAGLLPGGWGGGGLAATAAAAAAVVAPGRPLRSLGWSVPSEMTVVNDLEGALKVYWLNYDGDAELFGSLSSGSVFTVHTFQSHVWRFVDASSGATVADHVVVYGGKHVVRVVPGSAAAAAAAGRSAAAAGGGGPVSYTYTTAAPGAPLPQPAVASPQGEQQPQQLQQREEVVVGSASGAPDGDADGVSGGGGRGLTVAAFEGFDGLGNEEQQYSLAQLREIKIYPGGGNVLLALPGQQPPLELALAGPEALSLVAATGSLEQRRPSTLGTWTRSLLATGVEVRRVCITRMVDGIYYARIVLSRPDSTLCSLDATPGDSLSLALQLGRPIYVANEVARVHQSVLEVFAQRRRAMEAAAARGALDEEAEAEADREAQNALDSISRGIPSAPRPVRAVEMDRRLDA